MPFSSVNNSLIRLTGRREHTTMIKEFDVQKFEIQHWSVPTDDEQYRPNNTTSIKHEYTTEPTYDSISAFESRCRVGRSQGLAKTVPHMGACRQGHGTFALWKLEVDIVIGNRPSQPSIKCEKHADFQGSNLKIYMGHSPMPHTEEEL